MRRGSPIAGLRVSAPPVLDAAVDMFTRSFRRSSLPLGSVSVRPTVSAEPQKESPTPRTRPVAMPARAAGAQSRVQM